MFFEMLQTIKSKGQNVSIYTNAEQTSKFTFGSILNVNKQCFAMHMFTPGGQDDGILVKPLDHIYRIEQNGQYSEKMKKLMGNYTGIQYQIKNNKNLMQTVLLLAKDKNWIVSIELLDSGYDDVVGFVEIVSNDLCEINQIDSYGYYDGVSSIKLCEITQISCNSTDEQLLLKLWKLNNQTFNNTQL